MQTIDSFRKPYSFLSNFSKATITVNGITYPSLEHAYQAAKTNDIDAKMRIAATANPIVAKRFGKKAEMREDWDDVKLDVMRDLVKLKYQDEKLADKLIATRDAVLVEGNRWHDNFWGQCSCDRCAGKGQNYLGRILMEAREELKAVR